MSSLYHLEAAGVSQAGIVKQLIEVSGSEGTSVFVLACINLELIVGSIRTVNRFQVIGGRSPSYHVLLGDPGSTSTRLSHPLTTND